MSNIKLEATQLENKRHVSYCMTEILNCDTLGNGKFMISVAGQSMSNAGIDDGDSLIIDVALIPKNGEIAVVKWNNCFVVKRVYYSGTSVELVSDSSSPNRQYMPLHIKNIAEIELMAKVVSIIKKMC